MSTIIRNSTGAITVTDAAAVTSTSESGGSKKTDAIVIAISDDQNTMTINQHHNDKETSTATTSGPSTVCEALRQQNDALRQELHDIRREMDEITDQFRTEDAEEFKQLQAELEIAAKNCRILQFKLRKAEKRNENMECEKAALEDTIQRLTRDNYRTRDLDEELLIAKEVSVRLHSELEKSEESRMITEKLNIALKQHLDTLKESFNEKISTEINDEYHSWQLSINLYESLFREYILMEELTCLNSKKNKRNNQKQYSTDTDGHDVSDLMNSYQQKISVLNDEINQLKQDVINRDSDLSQLRIQNKILKQRSRSVDRTTNSNSNDDEDSGGKDPNRYRRGVSVDGGGNLREQLDASLDEVRLLKNKILRLEDELNSSALEKETLLVKLDNQSKQGVDDTIHEDLRIFTDKTGKYCLVYNLHQYMRIFVDNLIASIKDTKVDGKIINDLQQSLRSSRLNKQNLDDENSPSLAKTNQQTSEIFQQANEFLTLLQNKNETLNKIRYRLTNLTYDAVDTCTLLEELDTRKHDLEDTKQLCNQLQTTIDNLHISSKTLEEKLQEHTKTNQTLEKNLEKQKKINGDLQQENTRLSTLNAKQLQDLRHIEQLRQSIITFEKKLDQKQTRVNELSMKIIEKEDIIETKVKECQKHRLELRELETKYYTLGKQLEEQIMAMTKEMEKLNVEKEMLKFDLESLRLNQQNERPKSVAMEDEITRAKAECRQQIFDGEIESYKLRLNQSNYEKDELLKFTKDLEKKYKDLQVKYDADEQSWMRVKTEMSEKQRKYDESIKIKSELQNAVDRLRQKLYDLELYGQEKQNKYNIDKQQWETQRIELSGKINELEEQLSKVTKRQRKELETTWKKERTDLQKQLQQSQQLIKDLQKQISNREVPIHLTEKINVLMTENELLLTKIRELEIVVDDVHLLKTEMHRLRDKNSSDWNYWRKQQSDLYAQLRQQYHVKEAILHKFDRLQKHIKSGSENNNRLVRDLSVGPLSINSFQNEGTTKTSLSNFSRETLGDDIELPHGTIDGGGINAHDIVGAMDDSIALQMSTHDNDKQRMFTKTYSAQENTAASIEEIASKIDRVEDNLFSYRRFMDFIRAKSEKSASIVRDDSFSNISNSAIAPPSYTRLASAPPENVHTALSTTNQRRSRLDANTNSSHEHLPTSTDDAIIPELMSNSVTATTNGNGMGSSKNRFFSLSRRFRFRAQSPDKESESEAAAQPATVHFLDEDIDLETKERTARKSDLHGNRPSKGILKALRHRSPFRFRSKDAIIPEQEPSPSPQSPAPSEKVLVSPVPSATLPPKETRGKVLPPAPTQPKQRGRLVELRKTTSKSSPNTTSRKGVNSNPTPTSEPTTSGSTLVRRASGLKDLIHKFEATPSDRPAKPKRVTIESSTSNATSRDISQDDQSKKGTSQLDVPNDDPQRLPINKSKSIDMPDLLRNVSKDTTTTVTTTTTTKAILRHSNSNRQTASFDSTTSMVSASESILTTNSSTRRPTSTARPLMISLSKDES
ncbi:unnamed protein product [Rotaria socialis]|uniref:Uncharacterized protein n=1 Tax=Rotaria socialis TaxID=392032 RepID=A0A817ZVY0_9BILA|nr:unnamed protein product [Rotaria socialis]CAF3335436.1 unnamed protein product [Rotaria socialis]CAF3396028.1 unnamed protein product [Rotaria socialis]